MPVATANGIEIDYEVTGSASDPALVLIRGLGTQRIQWPQPLVQGLAERGHCVVCFDNRDVGGSEKLGHLGTPALADVMAALGAADPIDPPYTIAEMARDVVGLLDALGIERAHVLGISMGGMIAQHVAASHGARVRSLISIMSSSGAPGLPGATPAAMAALMSQPDDPSSRASVIEHAVKTARVFGSPGHPTDDATLRETASRAYDRCHDPDGVSRQLVAVLSDTGRPERLAQIAVPTLVIHGEDDPLVPFAAGRDTAARIPGARLHAIPGMGHDVPLGLVAEWTEQITAHTQAADAASG